MKELIGNFKSWHFVAAVAIIAVVASMLYNKVLQPKSNGKLPTTV